MIKSKFSSWGWLFSLAVGVMISGCAGKAETQSASNASVKDNVTVNIGIQQSLSPLLLARKKGWFEEAFAKVGVKVKWSEFQSGPPHFEALAADRLDFGLVGNSPPIAGQAANVPFKEIATTSDGLHANAILVPKDSSIQSIQELKGKKVAVAKGSSGFNLLYQAIDQAGLKPSDAEIIQAQPDEAKPAFETGAVDAWSIWEPFVSLQTRIHGARVLANGESLKVFSPGFTIVRTEFAKQHPELVVLFLKVYEKARLWEEQHLDEAIEIYAQAKKIDKEVVRQVLKNNKALNLPISDDIIHAQQQTADFQYELKAIKQKMDTSSVVDNSFIKQALAEVASESKK